MGRIMELLDKEVILPSTYEDPADGKVHDGDLGIIYSVKTELLKLS